jgi:hypothetical protein
MICLEAISFYSLQNRPRKAEIQTPRSAGTKEFGTYGWQSHVFTKAPANFADTSIASEIALSKVSVFGRKPHTSLKGMRCKTEWEKGNYNKKKKPRMCLFYPTNLRRPLLFLPFPC